MNRVDLWIRRQAVTKKIAYNLIRREAETDQEKISSRAKACAGCRFNRKGICMACSCIIEVKIESRTNLNKSLNKIEITHCPKGFWPGEEEVTKLYS